MSKEIHVTFKVNSMAIMKKSLNDLGIAFNEINQDRLSIERRFHPIVITNGAEQISCDDMDRIFVEGIQNTYLLNSVRDKAIREGSRIEEKVLANGEIHITVV